jgi:murein L,D-transpeptidase YcbB/YkuD
LKLLNKSHEDLPQCPASPGNPKCKAAVMRALSVAALFLAAVAAIQPALATASLQHVQHLLAQPDRLPLIVEKRRADIKRFYTSEGAGLLWLGQSRHEDLTARMKAAATDGLRPADYPADVMISAMEELTPSSQPSEAAWVELLYTGHFLDFASDLKFGRVAPRILYPDAYMPREQIAAVTALNGLSGSISLEAFLADWEPQGDAYRLLKSHLAHLRDVKRKGGFTFVDPGDDMLPGQPDDRIPALRQRLFEDGLLPATSAEAVFDKRLAFAVAQARRRYGLSLSSQVDAALVRALNIPMDRRLEQIANAMERIRWLPGRYARMQLVLNKGENRYQLLERGRVIKEGRAYSNCPDRNFTTLATAIEGVTLNPIWRTTPEYLEKELLPRLQEDPEAVASAGYYLRRVGAEVPLASVPWKQLPRRALGNRGDEFDIYLNPSEENPLGRYTYRVRRDDRLTLFELAAPPESDTFCNPYLPWTAFGIVEGTSILEDVIEPRVFPISGVEERISRGQTITFPARSGLLAVVSHQSAWVERGGTIRFGLDPYREDARLSAALSGRYKP